MTFALAAALAGAVAGAVLGAPGVAAAASPSLTRYPYLTDLVGRNATVNWATRRSALPGTVRYGRAGVESCAARVARASSTRIVVGDSLQLQWKARLEVEPDARYCYRPRLGASDLLGRRPAPRFLSQLPVGSDKPVTFAVLGDWGSVDAAGNPGQADVMRRIAASGARFAIATGDTAYPGGSQTNYGDLFQTGDGVSAVFGPLSWKVAGASLPLFNAVGNHGFNSTHLLVWPTTTAASASGGRYEARRLCCANGTKPGTYPRAWYAFDAGPARFYVLSAAWASGNVGDADIYENDYDAHWRQSSPQYRWLRRDLRRHRSRLKLAFFHHPLYADNVSEGSDPFLRGPDSLEGLLGRYGVAIAFSGHAHIYQRNVKPHPGSLITYVTGGGGASPGSVSRCSEVDAYAIGWSRSRGRGSACGAASPPTSMAQVLHFLKVTIRGSTVKVTPTDSLGRTFDVRTHRFPAPGG
jgi:hypothetical protein